VKNSCIPTNHTLYPTIVNIVILFSAMSELKFGRKICNTSTSIHLFPISHYGHKVHRQLPIKNNLLIPV